MFRASSAHLQEDTVVYMQLMVLSHFVVACRYTAQDYYLFIKYYSPLHVSSLKCSPSGGYSCIHVAYGTVTVRGDLSVHSLSDNHTNICERRSPGFERWSVHVRFAVNRASCSVARIPTSTSVPSCLYALRHPPPTLCDLNN